MDCARGGRGTRWRELRKRLSQPEARTVSRQSVIGALRERATIFVRSREDRIVSLQNALAGKGVLDTPTITCSGSCAALLGRQDLRQVNVNC